MKTCIVIPTYNEASNIKKLIKEIRNQGLEVLVIDDGSTDNTAQTARDNGAVVLNNVNNEGKGVSLIKGFAYALEKGFDAVITMDGDGQHLVEDVPFFMRLAKYSNSGIFIGNRMLKAKGMPFCRFLTNKFMSWLISKATGQKIPDTQCGFRLIKREVLATLNLRTCNYDTESEIIFKAARSGFKIESVPVQTVYEGKKSQINPFIDTFRFIRLLVKELWIAKP